MRTEKLSLTPSHITSQITKEWLLRSWSGECATFFKALRDAGRAAAARFPTENCLAKKRANPQETPQFDLPDGLLSQKSDSASSGISTWEFPSRVSTTPRRSLRSRPSCLLRPSLPIVNLSMTPQQSGYLYIVAQKRLTRSLRASPSLSEYLVRHTFCFAKLCLANIMLQIIFYLFFLL